MFRTIAVAFAVVLLVSSAVDAGVTKGRINETGQTTSHGVPAFDTHCWSTPGCTVKTCSCTEAAPYWSSSTQTSQNIAAWAVDFLTGEAAYQFQSYTWLSVKSAENHVRAVRGGL